MACHICILRLEFVIFVSINSAELVGHQEVSGPVFSIAPKATGFIAERQTKNAYISSGRCLMQRADAQQINCFVADSQPLQSFKGKLICTH